MPHVRHPSRHRQGSSRRPLARALLRRAAWAVAPAVAACARRPAPLPVTPVVAHEGFLTGAGGARLFYRVMGSAPDTVVVVHGGPGAGLNEVRPDLQPLARAHTVVFYDQRGGGRSELPADTAQLDVRAHVEDLDAVRRHFGLRAMRVVAHGFGALLVARYAESHPEGLERVVFLDAMAPVRAGPEGADALAGLSPARADSAMRQRLADAERALRDGAADDPVATCRAYEAVRREMAVARGEAPRWRGSRCDMPPRAVAYQFRHAAPAGVASLGDWDFTASLARLRVPLLVVHGADDADALASQRAWAAALPDARRLPVPRAHDGAAAARPDVVLPAIATFLAGRWPAGTVAP